MSRYIIALVTLAVLLHTEPSTLLLAQSNDPGCENATLVSTGGQFPRNPQTLAVRWTGFSNFELAYKQQIILLDAYFDRGSIFPPLGFTAADVKRANVLLIGHGHVDHPPFRGKWVGRHRGAGPTIGDGRASLNRGIRSILEPRPARIGACADIQGRGQAGCRPRPRRINRGRGLQPRAPTRHSL